jgi:hypothetical protein
MVGGRKAARPRARFVTGSPTGQPKSRWKPPPRRPKETNEDYETRLNQEFEKQEKEHYFRSEAKKQVRRGSSGNKQYKKRLSAKIKELEGQGRKEADRAKSQRLNEKRITRSGSWTNQNVLAGISEQNKQALHEDGPRLCERSIFVNPEWETSADWTQVLALSDQLFEFMNRHSTLKEFENANQPGTSSAVVQEVILPVLTDMGFTSEAKGLFADYPTKGLRPDYFSAVGNSGVIVEVERGKTTTNNMDLLDFWKCHICQHANYLFLLVPLALRHNETVITPKPEYETVKNRLSAFFRPGNYTNVKGLVLFGY